MKCTSCHKNLISEENFTKFKCPGCGEEMVVRCKTCRVESTPYKCDKCGFQGP